MAYLERALTLKRDSHQNALQLISLIALLNVLNSALAETIRSIEKQIF